MSKLAKKIAPNLPRVDYEIHGPGPVSKCRPLYGEGDLEDWQAMESYRVHGRHSWAEVHDHIDKVYEVPERLPLGKFKHHWRRVCSCWPDDLRVGK